MRDDWNEEPLINLCSIIKRGISPKYIETGGIHVINQRCIRDYKVDLGNARQNDLSKKNIPQDRYLESYDILVNSTGVGTLGRVAQIKEVKNKLTVDSHVTIVRSQSKLLDKEYLGYVLKSKQREIEYLGEGSTGQTELSRHRLGEIIIPYPSSLPEQKAIAHILGTLDNKIELNRKMNETLEAMAQALFKSWFVDFDPVLDKALAAGHDIPDALQPKAEKRKHVPDHKKLIHTNPELAASFPDRFVFTEELGWIPEGWEVKELADITSLDTSSVKPNKSPDKTWIHYSIPAYDGSQNPILQLGEEIKSNKYKVKKGVVLLSKLNPDTPRIWLPSSANESTICSTEFMQFVPSNLKDKYYLYATFYSSKFYNKVLSTITGSTGSRQRAQPKQVKQIQIIYGTQVIRERFYEHVEPIFESVEIRRRQMLTLQMNRNTLLPKLISGELRVPEALKLLKETLD